MLSYKQYITLSLLYEQSGVTGATATPPPPPASFTPTSGATAGPAPTGLSNLGGGTPSSIPRGPSQDPNFSPLRLAGAGLGLIKPASEYAAETTGRLSGLGYSTQGVVNRFNTYKNLGNILSSGGNIVAGLSGMVSSSARPAIEKFGQLMGGAGGAISGILGKSGKFGDEFATVMTAALYDPRAAGELGYTENMSGLSGAPGTFDPMDVIKPPTPRTTP